MWNKILLGFDSDDQTANFGTRAVAETSDSVYEATIIASIQAGKQVTKDPQLQAETCEWGGICVSVDASVTVFKDQSCREVLLNVTFDSTIESFQTSSDGSFLFVAVEGPDLHCIHIPSGGTHVFSSILLEDEDVKTVQIFCEPLKNETVHLTVVCSNGETLRCPNLNLKKISSALKSSSADDLKSVTQFISFISIASEECTSITAIDLCTSGNENAIAFGGKGIGIKSDFSMPADLYIQSDLLNNISIIRMVKEELFILALTSDGMLMKICSLTLICLQAWSDLTVQDFTVMPQSAENDRDILLLTSSEINQQSWLLLMSALTFEVKLRVKVSSKSCLVHLTTDQQEIMYLECLGEEFSDTIHLKTLVECSPIDRFHKLLRRNKFEEAQRYAHIFNLDMDEVSKGQAKKYVSELCPWSRIENANAAELTMSKLLTVLNNIQDTCFVCELCITAAVPDIVHVRQLYGYAKKRLSASQDRKLCAFASKVNAMECRLETCEIVNESSEFDTWVLFSKVNLLEECKRFLSMGELHRASVIWTRHFCEIKALLTPRATLSLLRAIPLGTPVHALIRWLSLFVPAILTNFPETFEDVLLWIIHIIKSMTSRQDWPESGFHCAQEILDLLEVRNSTDVKLNLFCQYSTPDSALKQFISLMKAVTHLKILKEKYHMKNIALEDLLTDDKSHSVQVLLKNVSIMRFAQFAAGFLESYVEEWDLDMDVVLFEYIESLVLLPSNRDRSDYAPWEFPVSTLLSHVKNPEQLLGGILLALKAAPVPWSDTIEKLAEQGLTFNHPFANDIKQQKSLIRLKLVLKKYDIKYSAHDEFDNTLTLMYIRRIIVTNLPERLEDCLVLCREDKTLVVDTYFYIFDHMIEQGNEDRAFGILDCLEAKPKLLRDCLRKIILTCSVYWDSKIRLGKYSDFLTIFENRLNRIDKSIGEVEHYLPVENCCIKELISLHRLYNKVQIHMTMKEYASESHRRTMLQSHITTQLNIGDRAPHCDPGELAELLKLSPEEGILETMKIATDYGFVEKAVAISSPLKLLDAMSSSTELKMIEVLTQMMAACKKSEHASVATMVNDIAVNACILSNSDKLTDWVTLCEWSRMVASLSNSWTPAQKSGDDKMQEVVLHKDWKLSPMFFDRPVFADKSSAIALIKDVYMKNNEALTKEILETVIAKLHRENNDLTGLAMIRSLYNHTTIRTDVLDVLWSNAACKLLLKVLLSRKFDESLCLALLFSLPHSKAHNWLKNLTEKYIQDIKLLESISSVAIVFYNRYYTKKEYDLYTTLHLRCVWAKRIIKLGLSARDAFNLERTPLQVLHMLMHVKQVPFHIIEKFCKAFDIDVNDQMLPFMKIIILSWEPEVQQCDSPEGVNTYTILNDEALLFQECKAIIERFKPCSKGMVYDMLESLMSKINYYFYETYLVLYGLMESLAYKQSTGKDKRVALSFLKTYKRVCQPETLELEMWVEAFPDSNGLPLLSKWRLPFRQFLSKDVWSIVKLEVNIDTYETWLKAAPIIGLDRNSVCSVAIKQSVKQVPHTVRFGQWCLHEKESFLISQIQRCVNKLTDPKSASAALFHVINNTPPGADLYSLAKLCYAHAKTWRQADGSELAKKCYEKVERKYLDVATSHILYSCGLGLPQYLELKTQPCELIIALYNDPSIIARGRKVAMHYPDINEAVEKLADLHSLKLNKILILQLDESITSKSSKTEWSDETFTEVAFSPSVNETQDEENRLRACYILQGNADIANKYLPYLVTKAYGSSVEESSKLQALRCLYSLASEARVEKLTGRKISAVRMFMQSLHYVVELSRFRISVTVPEFEACSKLDLVKMICQLHGRNKSAVELIIQMCYDFDVFQHETWGFVLTQLVNLKMDALLEEHLPRLAGHSSILITAEYIQAWHYILRIPFHQKDTPLTAEQEKLCLKKLELLESCPIVCSLELLQIVDQLLAVECPHLAAMLLPIMTIDLRETSVKKLLEKSNSEFIIEMLRKSDYDSFLTVQKAIRIVKFHELHL